MQPEVTTNNNIFKYAFAGVLLFIAAFAFAVSNRSNIHGLSTTTIVSAVMGIASLSLLTKAVKEERNQSKIGGI
jgi:hypothetical protein